jgi:hypothetical protein
VDRDTHDSLDSPTMSTPDHLSLPPTKAAHATRATAGGVERPLASSKSAVTLAGGPSGGLGQGSRGLLSVPSHAGLPPTAAGAGRPVTGASTTVGGSGDDSADPRADVLTLAPVHTRRPPKVKVLF